MIQNDEVTAEQPVGRQDRDVRELRVSTLDQMTALTKNRPEGETPITVPKDASFEYTTSSVVQHAENVELRGNLAKLWIQEMVDEGRYGAAAEALVSSLISETNMPEMQNAAYVGNLIEKAQAEGNDFEAWRVAWTVAPLEKNGEIKERLFKTETPLNKFNEGWVARERLYFEREIQEAITQSKETEVLDWDVWDRVHMAHTSWNFREDGYYAEDPHPLALDTAREFCRQLALRGMHEYAYQTAIESRLPQVDVQPYKDKIGSKAGGIENRIKRYLSLIGY
jgi:hypothetical protein